MKISNVGYVGSLKTQPVLSLKQKLDNWAQETYGIGRFEIARVLEQYSRGDRLSLNNYESESLPDVFNDPKFANLKDLNLRSMKLKTLPNSISSLQQLKTLDCQENRLNNLPENFIDLASLEKLNLSHNKFTSLPIGLNNLRNLQHLDVRANQLTTLEGVGLLSSLHVLRVAENELEHLPREIRHLTSLEELDLDSTELETLPMEINKLIHLKKLLISNNKFTQFPSQIGQFKELYKLDVSHNTLANLQGIGGLSNLIILDVSHNHLQRLPEEIGNLTKLAELDLSDNQLTRLHSSMRNLTDIVSLELSNNGIRIFPEVIANFISLRILNLSENRLERLPDIIGVLRNLEELSLDGNSLRALPGSIGECVYLRQLYLSSNPLYTLPSEIQNLRNLTHLFLNQTQLEFLPKEIGDLSDLEYLSLQNNFFRELPVEILGLPRNSQINLKGTPLLENSINAIQLAINEEGEGYEGPRFLHLEPLVEDVMFLDEEGDDEFLEVDQCLETIYVYAGKEDTHELPNLFEDISEDQFRCLHEWLNKVFIFKRHLDISLENTHQRPLEDKLFYKDITNILELANKNNQFKDSFWTILAEGSTTCGDRISLSIADLHIQKELIAFKLYQHQSIASLFKKGVWAMELSDEVAKKKIENLRDLIMIQEDLTQDEKNEQIERIDEVEIRLGYLLRLKEKLNLSIEVPGMLYYICSSLTEEDIQEAETVMLEKFADQDAFIELLLKKDLWKQVLEYKCARQMNLLKEAYEASDSEEAHIHYLDSLKKLTKELLEKPQPGRVGVRELNGLGVSFQAIQEAQIGSSKSLTRSMALYRA